MTDREHIRTAALRFLGKYVTVTVDRPLGSAHPKYPDMIYPINYGYIENTIGGDGEELDVYLLGVDVPVKSCHARVIGAVLREDDNEDKLVAAPDGMHFTSDEIMRAVDFQERYFVSTVKVTEQ